MRWACWLLTLPLAQGEPAAPPTAPPPSAAWQARVESRYREFESLLERMADLLRPTDPDRAVLLSRAFSESRRELVLAQLQEIVAHLEKGEFSTALKEQDQALSAMADILALLQDEERASNRRGEREQIEKQLEQAKRLSTQQRQLRDQTQKQTAPDKESDSSLEDAQKDLADEAKSLAEQLKQSPTSSPPEDSSAPKDPSKPPASPSSPKTPPSSSQAASAQSAEKAMRAAEQQLAQKKSEQATKKQDEAIDELEKTIDQLEESLEQKREEERQELLSRLAERLKEVKQQQVQIQQATAQLGAGMASPPTRADEQQSAQLARQEREVVSGLEQVLSLLLEDGTAIAFPETLEQVARDAGEVADRLSRFEAGAETQSMESDIIMTLDEMIAALDAAKGAKRTTSKGSSPTGGKSGKSPLVEQLAELKMIRSLQLRINERTRSIEEIIAREPNSDASTRAIKELADRQNRVYEITRDIARGSAP